MVLVAYRHGLRASELVDLRWDQIGFTTATLHVRRVKQGTPSAHPILGDELRALRRLHRLQEPRSPFVFTSERRSPFTTAGFARMIERAGKGAAFGFKAHPHMLRHAWIRTRQLWPRHASAAGVPRSQEHSAHCALHRAEPDSI
jgi:integrase